MNKHLSRKTHKLHFPGYPEKTGWYHEVSAGLEIYVHNEDDSNIVFIIP